VRTEHAAVLRLLSRGGAVEHPVLAEDEAGGRPEALVRDGVDRMQDRLAPGRAAPVEAPHRALAEGAGQSRHAIEFSRRTDEHAAARVLAGRKAEQNLLRPVRAAPGE